MKIIVIRVILVLLILLNFITIFNFSGQNGLESGNLSRKVTIRILNIFGEYNEPLSNEQEVQVENTQYIIRKLAHFSIYALLGLLLMCLAETFDFTNARRMILSLLIGILYASLDEFHQSFVPGRTASFTDILIDVFGIVVGILIIFFGLKILKNIKNRKIRSSDSKKNGNNKELIEEK